MKKLLLSLLLAIMTMAVSAQIQRTFFGCTLAATTRSEAIAILEQKGFKPYTNNGNGHLLIDDATFGAQKCPLVSFVFYNDKLQTVMVFAAITKDTTEAEQKFDLFHNRVKNKYSQYFVSDDSTELTVFDNITIARVSKWENNNSIQNVGISYTDYNLSHQQIADESSDI